MSKIAQDFLSVRSVITLLIFGTACFLVLKEKSIPPLLQKGCEGLFLVWFGEKIIKYFKIKKEV